MKKKDILVLLIAIVMIGGSGFAIYKMLAPAQAATEIEAGTNTTNNTTTTITGNIDEDAIEEVVNRTDYGEAALDGIGRTNPFGPLE